MPGVVLNAYRIPATRGRYKRIMARSQQRQKCETLSKKQNKKGWECGSSGRVLA
jgi:hypothetical protein